MIGGEIEIDPEYVPRPKGDPIWAVLGLPDGASAFFGLARQAVRWWADHLRPPGPVLVPAYCCRSVVQPLREAGVPYRYYPVDRRLGVSVEALRGLLDGAGSIQVIHYHGFPAPAGLFELGIPVLEDAVQALLSPELRGQGDWAVASFRKFFPVPDGAFLIGREAFRTPRMPQATGGVFGRKLYARMVKHEAGADRVRWSEAQRMLEGTEAAFDDTAIGYYAMSARTGEALRGIDTRAAATARRRNYTTLHDALGPVFADRRRPIGSLLGELPYGVVPYGYPLLAERRDALRAHLLERGIYTVVHWELPDDVSGEEFPDSHWIHERTLTLPVDQRCTVIDMATMAAAVAAFKA